MAAGLVRGGLLLGAGIAIGVGAALFGPAVWRVARPVAKSALRAGIEGYAAARVSAARVGEEVEDLVAEVIYEMSEAQPSATAAQAEAQPAAEAAADATASTR